jgi:hypothetical protein
MMAFSMRGFVPLWAAHNPRYRIGDIMTHPDIRRLQVLNDLITQTLDLLAQRSAQTPGIFPVGMYSQGIPGQQEWMNPMSLFGQGWSNPSLYGQTGMMTNPMFISPTTGFGQTPNVPHPSMLAQSQVPFQQTGLSHSPFVGYPMQSTGLSHSPFVGYPIQRSLGFEQGFSPWGFSNYPTIPMMGMNYPLQRTGINPYVPGMW